MSLAALPAAAAPANATRTAAEPLRNSAATAEPGACPWVGSHAPIATRVDQLLRRMSLDDELAMVHGTAAGAYTGMVAGNPSLCIPELKLQDGPVGVRMSDTTQLPSGTDLAATFDPRLAHSYGAVIGAEDRAKGVNVDLGPTMNIVRDPRWGRAFESYSEDPYLTGQIAVGDVDGIQSQGVMAQIKHWAVYNQETNRNTPRDDVAISDRAVHEIYAAAFGTVIDRAHPASAMCSYSSVNGTFACENAYLDRILEQELGFTGFITSDWGGTHSTVASANAGMDMEMPGSTYFGTALKTAVQDGQVPRSRLDDMVRRILTQEFRFGLFEHPFPDTPNADVSTPAHVRTALQVAEDGTVLLKDADRVLPLTRTDRTIAVIGDGAGQATMSHGGGSATVAGTGTVTPLAGITARAAKAGATVTYAQGTIGDNGYPTIDSRALTPPSGTGHGLQVQYFDNTTLSGAPVLTRTDPDVSFTWNGSPAPGVPATNFSARWTGTLTPPVTGTYTVGLTSDDGSRLFVDGHQVIDNWRNQAAHTETAQVTLTAGQPVSIEVDYYQAAGGAMVNLGWVIPGTSPLQQAVDLAASSDVAVVYANKYESEGSDLADIDLSADQNALIEAVAAANPRTVVVLNTGSAVTMPWLDKVAGVMEAWYPGQQSGTAIAALLYGDVNPSGKLPVTFPTSLAQVPAATAAQWPGVDGTVQYSEGLKVGYRWYDSQDLTPLFPFGFGLSYTSFAFSHLSVSPMLRPGGRVHVTAVVTNTGSRPGAEVAQLYLTDPTAAGEPGRQLKGFVKVALRPHESRAVHFTLTPRDASSWDTDAQAWAMTPGRYTVQVGDSSRSLPLTATFRVPRTAGPESTTVSAPQILLPGSTATVTTTYTNGSTQTARDARTSLDLPHGWTATATASGETQPAAWRSVPAGAHRTVSWTVSVPANAPAGPTQVSATTWYALAGLPRRGHLRRTNPNPVTVQLAYPNLAAAFNTVGVTDDADPGPGNFDGRGYSFSAQGLAAVGIAPGKAVAETGFVWPNVAAGQPDVVTTAGQSIALGSNNGAGDNTSAPSTLSFLGAANNGDASGTVTVTYTDGSTSTGTLTYADWWSNAAAPGTTLVATAYWNEPPDSPYAPRHPVSVYSAAIPLSPGKHPAFVTLPDNARMHVFAIAGG